MAQIKQKQCVPWFMNKEQQVIDLIWVIWVIWSVKACGADQPFLCSDILGEQLLKITVTAIQYGPCIYNLYMKGNIKFWFQLILLSKGEGVFSPLETSSQASKLRWFATTTYQSTDRD